VKAPGYSRAMLPIAGVRTSMEGAVIFLPWPGTNGAHVARVNGIWGYTIDGSRTEVGKARDDAERAALRQLRSRSLDPVS